MQSSPLTWGRSSCKAMAPNGQISAHIPHPEQETASTTGLYPEWAIRGTPLKSEAIPRQQQVQQLQRYPPITSLFTYVAGNILFSANNLQSMGGHIKLGIKNSRLLSIHIEKHFLPGSTPNMGALHGVYLGMIQMSSPI